MSSKRKIFLFALALSLTLTVLALQNARVGFESGHHGWVTSHHLAIIQRSTLENLGVGYTGEILRTDGSLEYWYFNRVPFVSDALAHLVLRPFEADLASYVHAAHQLQNLVYALTLVVAFLLARLWLKSDGKAVFASLMLGTGYYFLEYKDLVEQNRVGALAMILAVYAVADFERRQGIRRLLGLAAISASLGEAAPACFVFLVWFLMSAARAVLATRISASVWLRMPALQALILSGIVTAVLLGYNVFIEAQIREVAVADSTIVESAQRRLWGGEQEFAPSAFEAMSWKEYSQVQVRQILRGFLPHVATRQRTVEHISLPAAFLFLILGAAALIAFSRRRIKDGFVLSPWAAVGAGILYFVVMRRLVAFHDFTLTYFGGFSLVIWCYLADAFSEQKARILGGVAVVFLIVSLVILRQHHNQQALNHNVETAEFQRIRNALGSGSRRISIQGDWRQLLPAAPYAPFFYLEGHYITDQPEQAEFIISTSEDPAQESLSGGNERYFLYPAR